ncbi:MAG TPA: TonB-dependent receptor [Gemmatimonadales bacterium]
MSERGLRRAAVALAWTCMASAGRAQTITGAVEGWATDSAGAALASVSVQALGPGDRSLGAATSDPRGRFRILALPVGSCTVVLRSLGYRPVRLDGVPIRLGATTGLGIVRLRQGTLTLPALVVQSEAPLLDPATARAGGNLSAELFGALPVDRNFHALPGLLPQANLSDYGDEVNIAGSSGPENVYYVDGVDLTDPYRATASGDLPYNFIKEVQVTTAAGEAEYGRALGGVVNVVTRSGDNVLRGEAFGYFSGSGLAGSWRRGLADAAVEASADYDAGLAVSGPVVHNRLWFFTAYNRAVSTLDLRVPGFAAQRDRRTSHLFAAKLDWVPDAATAVALTVLGDPSRERQIAPAFTAYGSPTGLDNIDPFLGALRLGGAAVSLRGSRRVGRTFLLESAVSRFGREEIRHGDTERGRREPLVQDLETGRWSGGFGDNSTHRSVRWAVRAVGTWSPVAHSVRIGLEYEDNRLDSDVHFTDPGIVARAGPTSYQAVYLITHGRVRNRVVTAYLRDSWLATSHLRFNAGLRWDGQALIGARGHLAQRLGRMVQPRFAVIVTPGRARAKLFASFGRYSEQLPLFASATWWHEPVRNGVYLFDQDPRTGAAPLDSLDAGSHDILPEVPGLRGEYYDEVTLGIEQLVGERLQLAVRGVQRRLREVVDDGLAPGTGERILGNPGRGRLAFLPRPRRRYDAVEVTLRWRGGGRLLLAASYVLSRNQGNYTGLWDHDVSFALPNGKTEPDLAEQGVNADGLLPNDRPHVFKLIGARELGARLTLGMVFLWQSGTPLNELGATFLPAHFVNLRPRGTAGRTPGIRDLSLRVTWDVPAGRAVAPQLSLELLHIASARRTVTIDQLHFAALDADGAQAAPNPDYLMPTRYQPPMMVRLGGTIGL